MSLSKYINEPVVREIESDYDKYINYETSIEELDLLYTTIDRYTQPILEQGIRINYLNDIDNLSLEELVTIQDELISDIYMTMDMQGFGSTVLKATGKTAFKIGKATGGAVIEATKYLGKELGNASVFLTREFYDKSKDLINKGRDTDSIIVDNIDTLRSKIKKLDTVPSDTTFKHNAVARRYRSMNINKQIDKEALTVLINTIYSNIKLLDSLDTLNKTITDVITSGELSDPKALHPSIIQVLTKMLKHQPLLIGSRGYMTGTLLNNARLKVRLNNGKRTVLPFEVMSPQDMDDIIKDLERAMDRYTPLRKVVFRKLFKYKSLDSIKLKRLQESHYNRNVATTYVLLNKLIADYNYLLVSTFNMTTSNFFTAIRTLNLNIGKY